MPEVKKGGELNIRKVMYICVYGCIAIFLYWFFFKAHPLIVFDTDDWGYISETRSIFPTFTAYNPAKVFPELLMPLGGSIAAKIIYPLTGDYIHSFTVVYAFIAMLFILIYIFVFNIFIKKQFELSDISSIVISVIFLAFHFCIFRTSDTENLFMFRSLDLNSFVNYIIPSVYNAALMMVIIICDLPSRLLEKGNYILKTVFGIMVYLAIFSNLFSSVILAVFSGAVILSGIINLLIKKISFRKFVKDTYLHFLIILLWAISAYYEFFGYRSQAIRKALSISAAKETLYNFYYICTNNLNRIFFCLCAVVVFAAVILLLCSKSKDKTDRRYGYMLYLGIVCGAS